MTKRIAICLLALLLLLAGCTDRADTGQALPAASGNLPQPEGLFPFYRSRDYFTSNYGLVDTQGNIVVPLEYDYLTTVPYMDYKDMELDIPAAERYFMAGTYLIRSDAELIQTLYALVSPQGEFLTGLEYYYIRKYQPGGFVAISQLDPPVCVMLDERGTESPVTDPDLLWELEQVAIGIVNPYGDYTHQIQGPDVPEEGFAWTQDVDQDTFWGVWYLYSDDLPEGYVSYTQLFDRQGNRLDNYTYSFIEPFRNDMWVARYDSVNLGSNAYTSHYLFVEPDGTPVNGQTFQNYWSYNADPYLVVYRDRQGIVLDYDTLEELWSFPMKDTAYGNLLKRGEKQVFALDNSNTGEPVVLVDLTTRQTTVLDQFPGGWVYDTGPNLEWFLVNCEHSLVPPPGDRETGEYDSSFMVKVDGEVILSHHQNLYVYKEYLTDYRRLVPGNVNSPGRNGLYDLNGTQLLPYEFTELSVLDGNAVLVVRGDSRGIMDLAGNWIYRESVYFGLEE